MNMLLRALLCLVLLASPAFAEDEEIPLFSQAELDQMLAPIALYPDQLLAQVLMASTYPLEVVQAARWSRDNSGLSGQDAVRAVDNRGWDPSVKSLVAFPNVLAQMDADLDWTERLGDAFLAQQGQVMDTVQALRERAYAAGNLRSSEHVEVVREPQVIYVRPARPDVVYVPYYDPHVVYGSWWWPQYRPVYWRPWPGYYVPSYGVNLGYSNYGGFYWGVGITLGSGFFFSAWDWDDHYVHIVDHTPFYYRRPPYVERIWVHDYHHRRGVPYRHRVVEHRYVPRDGRPPYRADYYRDEDRYRRDYRDPSNREYRDRDDYPERDYDRSRDERIRSSVNGSTPANRSIQSGSPERDTERSRERNYDDRGERDVAPRGSMERERSMDHATERERSSGTVPGGSMERERPTTGSMNRERNGTPSMERERSGSPAMERGRSAEPRDNRGSEPGRGRENERGSSGGERGNPGRDARTTLVDSGTSRGYSAPAMVTRHDSPRTRSVSTRRESPEAASGEQSRRNTAQPAQYRQQRAEPAPQRTVTRSEPRVQQREVQRHQAPVQQREVQRYQAPVQQRETRSGGSREVAQASRSQPRSEAPRSRQPERSQSSSAERDSSRGNRSSERRERM